MEIYNLFVFAYYSTSSQYFTIVRIFTLKCTKQTLYHYFIMIGSLYIVHLEMLFEWYCGLLRDVSESHWYSAGNWNVLFTSINYLLPGLKLLGTEDNDRPLLQCTIYASISTLIILACCYSLIILKGRQEFTHS